MEEPQTMEDKLSVSNQKPVKGLQMLRGDEKPEQIQDNIDWEAVNEYEIENENGSKLTFKDVYYGVTTIVIFIRHFLCFTAKEYVEDLGKIPKESLEKARVRLVIIGCGDIKFMKQFRRDTGYWAEFYTDAKRELYTLMGCKTSSDLGDLSSSKHTKSSMVTGIVRSALRSTSFPGEWQGDYYQQGGQFIFGPGEKCHFAHIDKTGSDHHPINQLLDLVGVENVSFLKDSGVIIV